MNLWEALDFAQGENDPFVDDPRSPKKRMEKSMVGDLGRRSDGWLGGNVSVEVNETKVWYFFRLDGLIVVGELSTGESELGTNEDLLPLSRESREKWLEGEEVEHVPRILPIEWVVSQCVPRVRLCKKERVRAVKWGGVHRGRSKR